MDFGGGGGAPPPVIEPAPTDSAGPSPEDVARQAREVRRRRRGIQDLIIEPATNTQQTGGAVNTGTQ